MTSTPNIAFDRTSTNGRHADGLRFRTVVAVLLAACVFSVDLFMHLGGAIAVMYVVVLLLVARDGQKTSVLIAWSVACAVLTVVAFELDQAWNHNTMSLVRLSVSLAVNVVTTALLIRTSGIVAGLSESEARYQTIFDTLAVAIWEHDFTGVQAALADLRASGVSDIRRHVAENPDFVAEVRRTVRITDVNATALKMMEVTSKEAFFSHLDMLLPETDTSFAECIVAIDERRTVFQAETFVTSLSGKRIEVIVAFGLCGSGPLTRVPGSILDIAERKALQAEIVRANAELAQAQRASALGAMSALIAHEINQPLTAIHSYADAALRWLKRQQPDLQEVSGALVQLGEASRRARDVVQRVRSLVSKADMVTTTIDLNALVVDTAALLARDAQDHDGRIVVDCQSQAVMVRGDAILLKQVLVNLVVNALQAMESLPETERLVTVSISRAAHNVVVTVADQGPGWEDEAIQTAFQTFFTTKDAGMGLGLSICRTAMDSLGGTIVLSNGPERGAVVELTLPLAAEGLVPTPGASPLVLGTAGW